MIQKTINHILLCLICASGFIISSIASAKIINANPSNYLDIVKTLKAGDILQLEAGSYTQGLNLRDIHGDKENPIIISGPESGDAAIFYPRPCCNTLQLGNTSYVTIRYLTIDGQNMNYIDAINAKNGITHNITVEHLLIINHGGSGGPDTDSQATVGISTKSPAWDWIIRHNAIIRAGTGMYLGNSNGQEPFVRGIIEYNLIYDTLGYNIEIKHQKSDSRKAGIGLPTGDNKTIIRHNVFSKTNNASISGRWARPNLLVGHWPLSGAGSNDWYEIYGNFFYQNPNEALFQGEGNIALYNNVFVNDFGHAIQIVAHNDVPKEISVFYNTIVSNGRGINITTPDVNYTQIVNGNAVFSDDAISTASVVVESENVTDSYVNAVNYLANPGGVDVLDLFPVAGMLSGNLIATNNFQRYTDWNKDFNGNIRDNFFRGAYSGEGANPGWQPSRMFKPLLSDVDPGPAPEPDTNPSPNSDLAADASGDANNNGGGGAIGWFSMLMALLATGMFHFSMRLIRWRIIDRYKRSLLFPVLP